MVVTGDAAAGGIGVFVATVIVGVGEGVTVRNAEVGVARSSPEGTEMTSVLVTLSDSSLVRGEAHPTTRIVKQKYHKKRPNDSRSERKGYMVILQFLCCQVQVVSPVIRDSQTYPSRHVVLHPCVSGRAGIIRCKTIKDVIHIHICKILSSVWITILPVWAIITKFWTWTIPVCCSSIGGLNLICSYGTATRN